VAVGGIGVKVGEGVRDGVAVGRDVEVGVGEGDEVKVGVNVGDGGRATGNNLVSSAPIRRRWPESSTLVKLYWLQKSTNLVFPTPITWSVGFSSKSWSSETLGAT